MFAGPFAVAGLRWSAEGIRQVVPESRAFGTAFGIPSPGPQTAILAFMRNEGRRAKRGRRVRE